MQMGVGGVNFSGKKHYEGLRFNVISVTRRWVRVQFPKKMCYNYIKLERPLTQALLKQNSVVFVKVWLPIRDTHYV